MVMMMMMIMIMMMIIIVIVIIIIIYGGRGLMDISASSKQASIHHAELHEKDLAYLE